MLEGIPDRLTLNAGARLLGVDPKTLANWRDADRRFPRPDAERRYSVGALASYAELHRIEKLSDSELRAETAAQRAEALRLLAEWGFDGGALAALPLPTRAELVGDELEAIRRWSDTPPG